MILGLAFSLTSCVWYNYKTNKLYHRNIQNQPFDAIIVPGIPFNGNEWDNVMKMRVLWAVHLYREGITKHIIFSGSAVYTHFYETQIMKQYATALGVNPQDIALENQAEHSTENVYYGYVKARENGWTRVAVASDYVQLKMMKAFIIKNKIPVSLLPAKMKIISAMAYPDSIAIDTMAAYNPHFQSIINTQTSKYRFQGTLGKQVDFFKFRAK
jgi:uncharacterized SAM-binding protein YcdF (DUF218 family)